MHYLFTIYSSITFNPVQVRSVVEENKTNESLYWNIFHIAFSAVFSKYNNIKSILSKLDCC